MTYRTKVRRIWLVARSFLARATLRQICFLTTVIIRRRTLNIPVGLIAVTYRCQNDCVHCGVKGYRVRRSGELSYPELCRVIDQMASMGIAVLVLFGGEPLIRDDLESVIAYAAKRGILVKIDTKGLLLDDDRVQSLKAADINFIGVSVDDPDASVHDALRGRSGNHTRAIEAILSCIRHGLPVSMATYATKKNLSDGSLAKLIRMGKELGVTNVRVLEPTLSGRWLNESDLLLDDGDRKLLDVLIDNSFVYGRYLSGTCLAADKNLLFVSAYGDVQPCGLVPFTFGNIRTEALPTIADRMFRHRFLDELSPRDCVANSPRTRLEFLSPVPEGAAPPWDVRALDGREGALED